MQDNIKKLIRRMPYYLPLIKEAVSLANLNGNILDVGCGPGTSSVLLKKSLPKCNITGIDRNDKYIKLAQQENENINYIQGDCYKMPFPDNTFDCCFALNLLEVLQNPIHALYEMKRVVKKNGIICIIDIDSKKIKIEPNIPYIDKLQRINHLIKKKNGYDPDVGAKLSFYFEASEIKDYEIKEICLNNHISKGFENTLLYEDQDLNYLIQLGFFKQEQMDEMLKCYKKEKEKPNFKYEICYDCCYGIVDI